MHDAVAPRIDERAAAEAHKADRVRAILVRGVELEDVAVARAEQQLRELRLNRLIVPSNPQLVERDALKVLKPQSALAQVVAHCCRREVARRMRHWRITDVLKVVADESDLGRVTLIVVRGHDPYQLGVRLIHDALSQGGTSRRADTRDLAPYVSIDLMCVHTVEAILPVGAEEDVLAGEAHQGP